MGPKAVTLAFHLNLWSCNRHTSASKQPCNCISYAMHIHVRIEALELVTRARSQFLLALDVDVVRSLCLGRRGRKWGYAVALGEGDIFDKGLLFNTLADVIGSGDFWDIQHNTRLCVISLMLPKLLNQSSFYQSTFVRVLQRLCKTCEVFSVNMHTLQDNCIYFYSCWAEFYCFVGSVALNCLCCQSKLVRWLRPDSALMNANWHICFCELAGQTVQLAWLINYPPPADVRMERVWQKERKATVREVRDGDEHFGPNPLSLPIKIWSLDLISLN